MINEKVLGHKEYIKNTVKSGKYSRLFFSSELPKCLTIEVKNLTVWCSKASKRNIEDNYKQEKVKEQKRGKLFILPSN